MLAFRVQGLNEKTPDRSPGFFMSFCAGGHCHFFEVHIGDFWVCIAIVSGTTFGVAAAPPAARRTSLGWPLGMHC